MTDLRHKRAIVCAASQGLGPRSPNGSRRTVRTAICARSTAGLHDVAERIEAGGVVCFLASDAASYLTGVTFAVDGGIVRSPL